MEMIQLLLLLLLVVLNVVILLQVRAFFVELRTPIVKNASASQKFQAKKLNVEARSSQKEGRSPQNTRSSNSNRGDQRGRRNRNERPTRSPRKPMPIMGNEAATNENAAAEVANTKAENNPVPSNREDSGRPAPRVREESPRTEGRRPLEPRNAPITDAPSEEKTERAERPNNGGAGDFDHSQIRHGRRVTVKKPPQLEEEGGN